MNSCIFNSWVFYANKQPLRNELQKSNAFWWIRHVFPHEKERLNMYKDNQFQEPYNKKTSSLPKEEVKERWRWDTIFYKEKKPSLLNLNKGKYQLYKNVINDVWPITELKIAIYLHLLLKNVVTPFEEIWWKSQTC